MIVDSNPYQSPASATQPLPDADAPRRSTAGTVLRIVFAIPLLLYALACIAGAVWTAYALVALGQTDRFFALVAILLNLLYTACLVAWAVGLIRRHRRLTWYGFLGFILCAILTIGVIYSILEWQAADR